MLHELGFYSLLPLLFPLSLEPDMELSLEAELSLAGAMFPKRLVTFEAISDAARRIGEGREAGAGAAAAGAAAFRGAALRLAFFGAAFTGAAAFFGAAFFGAAFFAATFFGAARFTLFLAAARLAGRAAFEDFLAGFLAAFFATFFAAFLADFLAGFLAERDFELLFLEDEAEARLLRFFAGMHCTPFVQFMSLAIAHDFTRMLAIC